MDVRIRSQLAEFAEQCELKLKKNDHKTDWRKLPIEALVRKLEIELEEFKVALQYEGHEDAMRELCDISNFCMMCWDRLRQPAPGSYVPVDPAHPFPVSFSPTAIDPDPHRSKTPIETPGIVSEERWSRHGTWMDGNREVAKMYKLERPGEGSMLYYEDTEEVRKRKLPIVPEHIAKMLANTALLELETGEINLVR